MKWGKRNTGNRKRQRCVCCAEERRRNGSIHERGVETGETRQRELAGDGRKDFGGERRERMVDEEN